MNTDQDLDYIKLAIQLAESGVAKNEGGPFGAVIVKQGKVIGKGNNKVISSNDPTAHAEIVAIREACRHLQSFQLTGCTVYTSCEPCPMCLGAIYWARPDRIVYACTREDAAAIEFDDHFIYDEINLPLDRRTIPAHQCGRELGLGVFQSWKNKSDKTRY
jgi:tRNA(Arg) A34 adenosine deaminase TadA